MSRRIMPPSEVDSTKDVEKKPSQRRINKPLIEKRRRARINDSLAQLKAIVLEASDSKGPRPSKLEKADILEMTVEFIKNKSLANRKTVSAQDVIANDPTKNAHPGQYSAGYVKCLSEISKYLTDARIVDETSKKLIEHISMKIKTSNSVENAYEGLDTDLKNGKIRIESLSQQKQEGTPEIVHGAIDLSMHGTSESVKRSSELNNHPLPMSTHQPINIQASGHVTQQQVPVGLVSGSHVMLLVQLPVTEALLQKQFQMLPQNVTSLNPHLQTVPAISSAAPSSQTLVLCNVGTSLPVELSTLVNPTSQTPHYTTNVPSFVINTTKQSNYAPEVPIVATSTSQKQPVGSPRVYPSVLTACQNAGHYIQHKQQRREMKINSDVSSGSGEPQSKPSASGDVSDKDDNDLDTNPQVVDPDHWRPW